MIRVYDFRCPNGHKTEHFVDHDLMALQCPKCDLPARRILSAPRVKLEGITGSFPGAAMQWEKNRAGQIAKEKEHMRSTGEYLNGTAVSDPADIA